MTLVQIGCQEIRVTISLSMMNQSFYDGDIEQDVHRMKVGFFKVQRWFWSLMWI